MNKSDFLKLIDELLEKDPGTLHGPETLVDEGWDSLGVVSFIALVDEHFGFTVAPRDLAKCVIVDDLVVLVGPKIVP